jgi:cytoskeleton protein RodZ
MESFGEKLRKTRENLTYSIEQAARDTNISKRYLIALENEDFSFFPGETYLKGFLKNYADYLGLDGDELVNIYKNMKIQEQPIPLDQLLENKGERIPRLFVILGLLAAVGAVIAVLLIAQPFSGGETTQTAANETPAAENEYIFKDYVQSFDVAKGAKISVVGSGDEERGVLVVHDINNNVVIASDYGEFELPLGTKKQVDLNGDAALDIEIRVNDIYASGAQKHAKIELLKLGAATAAAAPASASGEESVNIDDLTARYGNEAQLITSGAKPAAFSVDVRFSGNCLFIYYIDGKPREQKYMYANQSLTLPVSEKADFRFSNAGMVTLQVNENQIQLGGFGQVAARLISWKKDEAKDTYYLLSLPEK